MDKVCKKCGNYMSNSEASYCPACGYPAAELQEDRQGYMINRNGWVYFIVNTVILLFLTLPRIQKVEFIFLILGIVLLWNLLLREKNQIYSASGKLAGIVFIDVLLVFVSFSDVWRPALTGDLISNLSNNIGRWILFVLFGIVCYGISVNKKSIFFQWIAFELFGLVFTFTWGWGLNYWSGYIRVFFLVYTILNFVWCLVVRTALSVRNEKIAGKRWMTFGLFAIPLFLRFFCGGVIEEYLVTFPERIQAFISANLGPGKMIFFLIILFGGALIMGAGEKIRCGCDALVMSGIACGIIILKATTVFFIPFVFVVFFIYGFIFVYLLGKEKGGAIRFPGINRALLLVIITVSMVVSLYLVSIGLWLLVLTGLVFIKILVPKPGKQIRKNFVPIVMIWMILEAVLAIWQFKLHPEAYLAVAVIAVSFFLMLRLITWKHPSVKINRRMLKTCMCIVFALFMFLPVLKNGTVINIVYDRDTNQVSADIEAKGKENVIDSVAYYWTDNVLSWGRTGISGNGAQTVMQEKTTIHAGSPSGRCLVVVTTDENGVRAEKKAFVPVFYYTLDGE